MSISELAETTAVVTGASQGFGRAIATSLVGRGARVVGVARSKTQLDELHQQLGTSFIPVVADLSTDAALAAQIVADYRPRVVVLNGGAKSSPRTVDRADLGGLQPELGGRRPTRLSLLARSVDDSARSRVRGGQLLEWRGPARVPVKRGVCWSKSDRQVSELLCQS